MQLENLSYISKVAVKIPNVLAIILFGSHARGEEHRKSDIDLLVIVKKKSTKFEKIFSDIIDSNEIGRRVVPVYSTLEELKKEPHFTFDILKEGIILYKSPEPLKLPTALGWNAMTIFSFSLTNLPQKLKLKLNKILYTTTRKKKKKEYKYLGLVEQYQGKTLGKGCFMVPAKKAEKEIEELFEKYKVRYKKENVISIL